MVALRQGEPAGGHGGVAVFLGKGDGTFWWDTPVLFCVDYCGDPPVQVKPCFVEIVDLDQDGFNDIVSSNNNTHNISVLINAVMVEG